MISCECCKQLINTYGKRYPDYYFGAGPDNPEDAVMYFCSPYCSNAYMRKIKTMTRRIKKDLKTFFDNQSLTDFEKSFILGCINAQNKFPQLTQRQWEIVKEIEERYKCQNTQESSD